MKIAYVCADRGIPVFGDKGASVHVQAIVRAFIALGHEVRIICARTGEQTDQSLDVEQVSSISSDIVIDRSEKERAAMAIADEIEKRLIQLHRDWQFDFIYERYSLWSAAGCKAARELNVPSVVEVNAPLVEEQALYRQFECRDDAHAIESDVVSSATTLIAVSHEVSDYLVDRGASASRIHVLGNAVDTDLFSTNAVPARLNGVAADDFVVGFSGSLKMWHGIDILMRAYRDFHKVCPNSRLLLVGEGPKRSWAQGFVDGAGLGDRVVFTGWVPHHDLPAYLARMNVATAPYPASETHYFSPLKLYEYLAVGCPIVASRIGQSATLLQHEENALLVEPGNAEALTDALVRLYADREFSGRLASAAAIEGARHDWKHNAQRVIELTKGGLSHVA